MATSTGVFPWTLTMPAGSVQQWLFSFTMINPATGQNVPYDISGATWEYVVRVDPTNSGTPLITIDTAGDTDGVLTVTQTATESSVLLTINPAATANLTPQTYWHSLWASPGTLNAYTWMTGMLIVTGNPQP